MKTVGKGKAAAGFFLFISLIGIWFTLLSFHGPIFKLLGITIHPILCYFLDFLIILFLTLGAYINIMNLLGFFFPSVFLDLIEAHIERLMTVKSKKDRRNELIARVSAKLGEYLDDS